MKPNIWYIIHDVGNTSYVLPICENTDDKDYWNCVEVVTYGGTGRTVVYYDGIRHQDVFREEGQNMSRKVIPDLFTQDISPNKNSVMIYYR